MCLVKKPQIPASSATNTTQNLPIIRNPLLDGLVTNEEQGNNPFRIDLINPLTIPGGAQIGSVSSSSGFAGGSAPAPAPTAAGTGSSSGGSGSFTGGTGGGGGSFGLRINKL